MYGAILGDIAGSRVEFGPPQNFDYRTTPIFASGCAFTDDTVLTIATKYAILNDVPYIKAYRAFGKKYRKAGYGTMFIKWLDSYSDKGYNSYGNGAAMRVSFIGEYFDTLSEVEKEAEKSAMCTHNHPDGMKAAIATAGSIFIARHDGSKDDIRKYLQSFYGMKVNVPLACYRPFTKFDPTANATMPLVARCFLESKSWESCIRNVFSLTCDADTVGCISGGIAEAFYKTTKQENDKLLRQYLIRPDSFGKFDEYLYKCAVQQIPKK